jgi:hypothetical protein
VYNKEHRGLEKEPPRRRGNIKKILNSRLLVINMRSYLTSKTLGHATNKTKLMIQSDPENQEFILNLL